jgi:hypothetical protein
VIQGNPELRLPGTRDGQTREKLRELLEQYEKTRTEASAILSNLQGLVAAREAQTAIVADSEPLRRGLDTLQQGLAGSGGFGGWRLLLGLLALAALAIGGFGLLRLFERLPGRLEAGAGVGHGLVEEEAVEVVRQVVVRDDVASRPADPVASERMGDSVREDVPDGTGSDAAEGGTVRDQEADERDEVR